MPTRYAQSLIDISAVDHSDHPPRAMKLAQARLALDAGRMGHWSHYIQDDKIWGDQRVVDLLGFDFANQPWTMADFVAVVHPDDRDRVHQKVEAAYAGQVPYYDVEMRLVVPGPQALPQEYLWVGARGQVTDRDAAGNPLHLVGVVWDISEVKKLEAKLSMLAAEMDHRVKNAFAVIGALINIGAETSDSKESFAQTIRAQVAAMATAHDLSARMARATTDAQASITLADVVTTALSPWITIPDGSQTIVQMNCDPDIKWPPYKISAFTMLLYELTTNAAKYGPLGEIGGTLTVDISRDDNGGLTMMWTEQTATAQHTMPSETGFGEVLLDHCARNLNATITRDLTPTGLNFQLMMQPVS